MRELRVVGLGEDTATVVLEDPIRHERFVVPSDERLRAAARGDVRRLGQMEIETTSPLRPRDIQARIRSGESVADVAAGAGVPTAHVERFAYPVLLERSRVAEMAGRGHPLGEGGAPDPRSLLEILTATFSGRGQDLGDGSWDAWKGEDGGWIVSLSWRTGHSDHLAHWTFTPGASGGAVVPRDDPARDLLGLEPTPGPRRRADGSAARAGREQADDAGTVPDEQGQDEEDEDLGQGALAVGGGSVRPRGAGRASGPKPSAGPGASGPEGAGPEGTGREGGADGVGRRGRRPGAAAGRGSRKVPDQRGADQRDQPGPGRDDGGRGRPRAGPRTRARTHPPDRPVLGGRPARRALAALLSPDRPRRPRGPATGTQPADPRSATASNGSTATPIPAKAPHTAQRHIGTRRFSHSAGTSPATTTRSMSSPTRPSPATIGSARVRFASSTRPRDERGQRQAGPPRRRLAEDGGHPGAPPPATPGQRDLRHPRHRAHRPQRHADAGDGVAVVHRAAQGDRDARGEVAPGPAHPHRLRRAGGRSRSARRRPRPGPTRRAARRARRAGRHPARRHPSRRRRRPPPRG